jgi:hypothetical protein
VTAGIGFLGEHLRVRTTVDENRFLPNPYTFTSQDYLYSMLGQLIHDTENYLIFRWSKISVSEPS